MRKRLRTSDGYPAVGVMLHGAAALLAVLAIGAALTGCSSGPGWEARLESEAAVTYQKDVETPFKLAVSDKQGPVSGLAVQAVLEMEKMDHDIVKVDLRESGGGLYEGMAVIPMAGSWIATVTMEKDGVKKEQAIEFDVVKPTTTGSSGAPGAAVESASAESLPLAAVNDELITQEDLDFYAIANEVQAVLDGSATGGVGHAAAAKATSVGADRNSLLAQIIRLHAISLLAKEKGHQPPDAQELEAQADQALKAGEAVPELRQRIEQFGADKFRRKQIERLAQLSLAKQVQSDVEAKVKEEHPKAPASEIRFQTSKAYEELIVSQMSTLKVKLGG